MALGVASALLCAVTPADARQYEKEVIAYGGVALTGSAADFASSFPHLNIIGTEKLGEIFQGVFRANADKGGDFSLQFDRNISSVYSGDSQKVLALIFTGEDVGLEYIPTAECYKYYLDLSVELLVLDFSTLTVVASQPIYYQFLDVSGARATSARLTAMFQAGLTGATFRTAVQEALTKLQIRRKDSVNCQVRRIELSPDFRHKLSLKESQVEAYKHRLAVQYGALLVSELKAPLLPYREDAANRKMALRFADGNKVNFSIPAPTYCIDLVFPMLARVTEQPGELVYGSFMAVTLKLRTDESRVFFDKKLKFGYPEEFPVSMGESDIDDALWYRKSINRLFEKSIMKMRNSKRMNEKVLIKWNENI